jgi:putative mRNA 3-end processing factor
LPSSPKKPLPQPDLIQLTPSGLFCPPGDFYIDAFKPVKLNLVTHGHADHARYGSSHYLSSKSSVPLLKHRLGDISIEGMEWGEKRKIGSTWVSFHPAGHILGSAQIRIEHEDRIWVFTGDFKRGADPSCEPFEIVKCDTLLMESTFGLPIYKWDFNPNDILDWWHSNKEEASVIFSYSLGKAQRLLSLINTDETILVHGAIASIIPLYENAGIKLAKTATLSDFKKADLKNRLILAPPSASGSLWMRRFPEYKSALASGWMAVRGNKRRQGYDKGFVLSDHAHWDELIQTVKDTEARRIITTHGYSDQLAQYLSEQGYKAKSLHTPFEGDEL